jgi:DNA mismatch endonuclease (patch repair protein)
VDVFSADQRSKIMSRVKGRNTRPELIVRRLLHAMGYRFRLHAADLPGKPDIVLPRHGKIVQVHGCFWHGHKGCSRATRPQSNVEFWAQKIDGNKVRDARTERQLRRLGWSVLTVWECQTKGVEKLERRLRRHMEK